MLKREGGGVGALRGGKLRAAETRRCSATAQGAVECLGEAATPCIPNIERAGSAGPGTTPPSCGADSVGGPGGGGIWHRRGLLPAVWSSVS